MNKWAKLGLHWLAPALVVAVYVGLWLTNGSLSQLFQPTAWGSYLYANVWDHLTHGSLAIEPRFANGEYFIVGAERYVTYFGVMPALLRGIASLYSDIYTYGLANLSMITAVLLGLGSVWYTVQRITASRRARLIGLSIVLAILVASPLSYILVWSWTYHEVILWGVAWALMFVSLFVLWLFDRERFSKWHGLLMGVAVGMAVLCRPTMGLMLIPPFAFICVQALWSLHGNKQLFRLFLPGMLACVILAAAVLAVNYARWGSPFTFVKIAQNVQFVELFPERRAHIQQAGEFNITRLPSSLYYYLVPNGDNITSKPPFITIDRELTAFNNAPHYDYIEGSRTPLPLSALYLLTLAVIGAISIRQLSRSEKIASAWLLGGVSLTSLALLTVYALAVRYSVEFVPGLVFLALIGVVALQRRTSSRLPRKYIVLLLGTGAISIYCTVATTLAYKEFVWDVPPAVRESVRQIIHYSPTPSETKHIIDGKRFPIY